MFQRDFLMNEARKFALLLAKLMGLKADGRHEEYVNYFNDILQDEYNAELEALLKLSEHDFTDTLSNADYSTEKLNALSQMLYVFAEPFNNDDETAGILNKVLIIFNLLETQHHYESFDNITKRNNIYNYFKNTHDRA
jgi:hypothetical protein